MTDREIMQMVGEVFGQIIAYAKECGHDWMCLSEGERAIAAISERLIQPDAAPIAWMVYTVDGSSAYVTDNPADILEGQAALPLYTKAMS